MDALRRRVLKHTQLANVPCGTIRLRLLKMAATIRVTTRRGLDPLQRATPCRASPSAGPRAPSSSARVMPTSAPRKRTARQRLAIHRGPILTDHHLPVSCGCKWAPSSPSRFKIDEPTLRQFIGTRRMPARSRPIKDGKCDLSGLNSMLLSNTPEPCHVRWPARQRRHGIE